MAAAGLAAGDAGRVGTPVFHHGAGRGGIHIPSPAVGAENPAWEGRAMEGSPQSAEHPSTAGDRTRPRRWATLRRMLCPSVRLLTPGHPSG